jgi:prolyl 4-hydroxylase
MMFLWILISICQNAVAAVHDRTSMPELAAITRMSPCWADEELEPLPNYTCYLRKEAVIPEPPQYIRVFNLYDTPLHYAWDGGKPGGVYLGQVQPGKAMTTTSYKGHSFIFSDTQGGEIKDRVTVSPSQRLWVLGLDHKRVTKQALAGEKVYLALKEYADKYKAETGRFYIGSWPPVKMSRQVLPGEFLGQKYNLSSATGGHWKCDSDSKCDINEPLTLTVMVLSVAPRVLLIENFISEEEMALIRRKSNMKQATVGDGSNSQVSDTRKSDVGWIQWIEPWMKRISQRTADIFNFKESHLTTGGLAEALQLASYNVGGKYSAHFDFGDREHDRMLTLLHYLDPPTRGGGTAFPLAAGGKGIVVNAPTGTTIAFYSMLEDGNRDELSLHDALIVEKGFKFVSNQWIHDRSARIEQKRKEKAAQREERRTQL